jgi:hypothetical protein
MAELPLHELSGEEVVARPSLATANTWPSYLATTGRFASCKRKFAPHNTVVCPTDGRCWDVSFVKDGVGWIAVWTPADVMAAGGSWHRIPGAGEQRTYRPGGTSRPRRKEAVAPFRLSKVHWSRPFLSLKTAGA